MDRRIKGIFHNPWKSEYQPPSSLTELYSRALWLKSNPRNQAYMEELFAQHYPDGLFINADEEDDWPNQVTEADVIVLLYPDAIGIKFLPTESVVKKTKNTWATVRVLNGRRRDFLLSSRDVRQLRLRLAVLLNVFLSSPVLRAFDECKYFSMKLHFALIPVMWVSLYVGIRAAGLIGAITAVVIIQTLDVMITTWKAATILQIKLRDLKYLAPVNRIKLPPL